MLSKNEWGTLKKVIVGVAAGAQIPRADISLRTVNYAHVLYENTIPYGPYPNQVIEEATEDLEIFCNFLKGESVEVLRPDTTVAPSYYNYCPRDSVLVHKDKILATPQPLRARHNEFLSMDQHFKDLEIQGAKYIIKTAQKNNELYNIDCVGDKSILALTEVEPAFDAANILRDNDNLYYLISNSGNMAGLHYLQELVGKSTKVWPIKDVYSYMHLDSTMALLREGLILLNPSRIKDKSQLPKPLRSWEIIWAPEPVDIGYFPGFCGASPWLNINLFSVNPNLVVLEERQHNLRKQLEKHNIDCAMLPGRQQRTLSGGFHCVTLDLLRN
jgi:glycine amidinotransferase